MENSGEAENSLAKVVLVGMCQAEICVPFICSLGHLQEPITRLLVTFDTSFRLSRPFSVDGIDLCKW